MDRRSWLWRRKSSEKSPSGETESSGSVSSHSERFSDDQTLNHKIQSPEVTSKAARDDERDDSVKTLSEKLTEALLNIRAKEDLVKQHSKVAEEAVSGWERAENEVSVLKKQNDALTQKNSILEERVGHLDGALKECLRQLRHAREENEDKISEVRSKLEAAEKENSILKLKLLSRAEELEVMKRERDLSTHAAETASKHHLDNIKRVSKLEAESLRLKALARKATNANDNQSVTASSVYVESFTDSHSDYGERVLHVVEDDNYKVSGLDLEQFKHERSLVIPSVEIDLMGDFLEMERLVALPETHSGEDTQLRYEMEAMIKKTAELEDNVRKITIEKVSLEIALNETRDQLKTSEDRHKQTSVELVDLKMQLARAKESTRLACEEAECTKAKLKSLTKLLDETETNMSKVQDQFAETNKAKSIVEEQLEDANIKKAELESQLKVITKLLDETERNLVRIQDQFAETNKAKSIVEVQLEDANIKKAESESQLKVMELECENLRSNINTLEKQVENEKVFSRETVVKCGILEAEISKMKSDAQLQKSSIVEEFRINQDNELAVAASKFAECQKTIASLGRQLKSLATLDDFLIDSERSEAVL